MKNKKKKLLDIRSRLAGLFGKYLGSKGSTIITSFKKNPILKKNMVTPIGGISIVSLVLLIFFSPVCSIMLLVVSSFYFLYVKTYKSIYKIWFITVTIWYLIFTSTLAEIPIIIGFTHTKTVLIYLIQNDVLFANLCFQTVVIFDLLSSKLGFPIYIPAFINIIKTIIDFFKQKPSSTNCGKKKDSDSSQQNPEKQSLSGWFGSNFWTSPPTRGDKAVTDNEQCLELAKELKRAESTVYGIFHSSTKTNGDRTSEQISVKIPFVDTYTACFGRKATKEEKRLFEEDKKNSK